MSQVTEIAYNKVQTKVCLISEEKIVALIVMKFGGTSVADSEKIRNVSSIIEDEYRKGNKVAAVLSAQGSLTDELTEKAFEISNTPDKREMDVLLSSGEQISIALCAMELLRRGVPAVSLTGWQAGIETNDTYGDADIKNFSGGRLRRELEGGKVAVVAGFQGVCGDVNITTLGRGGSDTTAVFLAAALGADECRIYKDVKGIYTSDPKADPDAKLLSNISYDDMLTLADSGSGVLHRKCIEIAKRNGIKISVASSFYSGSGTVVG